jgi:hypothetical protein
MNRRDFLLLCSEGKERILEISCQKLYVHCLNARARQGAPETSGHLQGTEWWIGESSAAMGGAALDDIFLELQEHLRDVDKLLLRDAEWLLDEALKRRVQTLLKAFEERGGEVTALHSARESA